MRIEDYFINATVRRVARSYVMIGNPIGGAPFSSLMAVSEEEERTVYDGSETGVDPFSPPPNDFEGMTSDEISEVVKEWFFANFSDPVEYVSYSSREGGYQYVFGPYSAFDVVGNVFAGVLSDELISAIVSDIETVGVEWVPDESRLQPPDGPDEISQSPSTAQLHGQMLESLAELERRLGEVETPVRGIGDNKPPEPIDDDAPEPLSLAEIDAARNAIAELKASIPDPDSEPSGLRESALLLLTLGKKVAVYLGAKADLFITEAMKAAGAETGKLGTRLTLWSLAGVSLHDAAKAALAWLNSIVSGF